VNTPTQVNDPWRWQPTGAPQGITPAAPVTLSWRRFEDAAREAGLSRLYGGIHFDDGDVYARDIGKKLGEGAFTLAKKLWDGG
jgi:hypothetical protein